MVLDVSKWCVVGWGKWLGGGLRGGGFARCGSKGGELGEVVVGGIETRNRSQN